jgi:hypothetical protein
MILSILSSYLPDIGDLFLLIISVLLGLVAFFSKQQVNKMDKFMRDNTVDHMNMEKRLVDIDTWTKAVHETQIEPTLQKANKNEKEIIDIRGKVRNHERRISKIEMKIE